MKRTIAAISASVLGIGGAALAGAAPASAVTPKCTDATQHVVNPAVGPGDTWYMTCIPQYGMGKAEFVITTPATDPFPSGYSLDDGHQTVTSSPTAAQVKNYFEPLWDEIATPGTAVYTGAFMSLAEDSADSTPTTQPYETGFLAGAPMVAAYPIKSVGLALHGLPADCTPAGFGATYEGQYEVVFGTTTTHFSETIDDIVHSVTVKYTPAPLYLGLNFDSSSGDLGFDPDLPLCASSGGSTTFSPNDDGGDADWAAAAYNATNLPPILETLSPANGDLDSAADPEDAVADTTAEMGSFAVASTPVLATTGVDAAPTGLLGAGLLSVGILSTVVGIVRRRRRVPVGSR